MAPKYLMIHFNFVSIWNLYVWDSNGWVRVLIVPIITHFFNSFEIFAPAVIKQFNNVVGQFFFLSSHCCLLAGLSTKEFGNKINLAWLGLALHSYIEQSAVWRIAIEHSRLPFLYRTHCWIFVVVCVLFGSILFAFLFWSFYLMLVQA